MTFEETLETLIRKVMREELAAANQGDKLLTAEQVAEDLGYTDVGSVYRLRREKKLRAVNLSENAIRFKRSEVQRFIETLNP